MTSTFKRRRLSSTSRRFTLQRFLNIAVLVPYALAFGEDVWPLAAAGKYARHDLFGVPQPVNGGGIDPVQSMVQSGMDRGRTLGIRHERACKGQDWRRRELELVCDGVGVATLARIGVDTSLLIDAIRIMDASDREPA